MMLIKKFAGLPRTIIIFVILLFRAFLRYFLLKLFLTSLQLVSNRVSNFPVSLTEVSFSALLFISLLILLSALVIGLLILLLPKSGDIMAKNIQISYDLFRALCDYFFTSDFTGASWLADDIRSELRRKQERLNARELFCRYKTSSGTERETARREYLDAADILEDFRTAAEIRQPVPPDDFD